MINEFLLCFMVKYHKGKDIITDGMEFDLLKKLMFFVDLIYLLIGCVIII